MYYWWQVLWWITWEMYTETAFQAVHNISCEGVYNMMRICIKHTAQIHSEITLNVIVAK